MNKWLNYDLHMHSYASEPSDGGRVKEMKAEDFIKTLEDKKIDVFSITDHDTFDGKYYTEIVNLLSDRSIRVLFGSELNVYIDEAGEDRFQMGVYFQPRKENAEKIEKAITELYKDGNRPTLFKILNKFNSLNLDFIIIPEFDKSKGLTKISETLVNKDMMDDYRRYEMQRIFNAYDRGVHFEEKNVTEWAKAFYRRTKDYADYCDTLDDEQKNEFTKQLNLYLKGEIDRNNCLESVAKYGDIIKNYSFEFAYFHFSDWHNAEPYEPGYRNLLFGDPDHPFDTLEIAVCDPYSRIRIIKQDETMIQDDNSLSEINFSMDGRNISIPLTEGLNSIIGKRASGKSLLINVLMKLIKSDDNGLSNYESINIDVDSINAKKTNGTVVGQGQLSSVTYLKQSQIKGLYDKPSTAESVFLERFPKLPEIKISNLDFLIEKIDSIKPLDKNYKEFNTYFIHKNESKIFTYKRMLNIDKASFDTKLAAFISSYGSFKDVLKTIGFGLHHIGNIQTELTKTTQFYRQIVDIYADLINAVNEIIGKHVKEVSDKESISSQIKKNYQDSLNVIKNNFDSLLLYKQIEKKINDLESLNVGEGERSILDEFLFASEYSCTGFEIKTRVEEAISNALKPAIPRSRINKTLKEYLNGEAVYSNENQTFSNSLNREFKSTSFETKNTLYRIKKHHLYNEKTPIKELVENGCLINITNSSPGDKAAAYLEILMSSFDSILVLDQPEDDIDNNYISRVLVPLIRKKKRTKQLIFVTHNPSVAVYADAFNYVFATNDDTHISYKTRTIVNPDDKEVILDILDGGRPSFYNRNMKYGDVTGEFRNADNNN